MEHFKPYVAVFLRLEKDGELLLMKRMNTGYMDGKYDYCAGHLEDGEHLKDAMIREAKEELDIIVRKEDLNLIHVCYELQNKQSKSYLRFVFQCTKWDGTPKANEPNKCGGVLWVKPDRALPDDVEVPYYTRFMSEAIYKKQFLLEI